MNKKILKTLRDYPDIIIKPADKGSSIVILNTQDYILEAQNQLSNPKHYRKIPQPIHPNIKNQLNNTLNTLKRSKIINFKQVNYLKPPQDPRARMFYLLTKIHKPKDKWPQGTIPPGRPIVSDCSNDTYKIPHLLYYS